MSQERCEVWLYHLERATLEQVVPELLEKTLSRGWRARIRADTRQRIEAIDAWLWTYRDDSFLPHGMAGDPLAERQPILLGEGDGNPNHAQVLFVVDTEPGDIGDFARCIVVFEGRDEAALAAARDLWSRYRNAGHGVTYWRQGEQGWEKRA